MDLVRFIINLGLVVIFILLILLFDHAGLVWWILIIFSIGYVSIFIWTNIFLDVIDGKIK